MVSPDFGAKSRRSVPPTTRREMPVGEDGKFETEVPLEPGANRIAVRSFDRFGREAGDEETLRVDRRPPPVRAKSEGWQ